MKSVIFFFHIYFLNDTFLPICRFFTLDPDMFYSLSLKKTKKDNFVDIRDLYHVFCWFPLETLAFFFSSTKPLSSSSSCSRLEKSRGDIFFFFLMSFGESDTQMTGT